MPQKGQITRKQLQKAAKIYAAGIVYNALGCGGDSELLTEEQHEYFANEVDKWAGRIAKGLPDEVFKIGSLDEIIIYAGERTDNKA